MAQVMLVIGWILDVAAALWIGLILLEILLSWLWGGNKRPGLVGFWLVRAANLPVNFMRRSFPTVYRRMDFAPWLTLIVLVLLRTFVFRAVIYWASLQRVVA